MGRVLSPYEIAWRKSVGHPVDDDDELERLTAPGAPVAPVVTPEPAPAAETSQPAPAPVAAVKPDSTKKK